MIECMLNTSLTCIENEQSTACSILIVPPSEEIYATADCSYCVAVPHVRDAVTPLPLSWSACGTTPTTSTSHLTAVYQTPFQAHYEKINCRFVFFHFNLLAPFHLLHFRKCSPPANQINSK